MKKFLKRVLVKFKNRNKKIKLAKGTNISPASQFEGNNYIGENSSFCGKLGKYSYMGKNCEIVANIGKYCSIANNVHTIVGKHPTPTWVSTHPVFYSDVCCAGETYLNESRFLEYGETIEIGNDVWIGHSAGIMEGVKIGDGAIIAAGALVTKDVEPYSIVGGVPAKVIKYRFEKEEIEKLLKLKWWDLKEEEIKKLAIKFNDIEEFLKGEF